MTITDKTRKLLWGKSGNRCAMCRHELSIDRTDKDIESIVGDECHIISGQEGGPRYSQDIHDDQIDAYDNLILLCRIHHKLIDDQSTTYTADLLRQIKKNHEKWVSEKLDNRDKDSRVRVKRVEENIPKYLRRLTSGQELLNIVLGSHSYLFNNDELQNEEEVERIGEFVDIINDWGDLGLEMSAGQRIEIGFKLTKMIEELDQYGFWVFGANEKQVLCANGEQSDWQAALIEIKRKSSKDIIDVKQ